MSDNNSAENTEPIQEQNGEGASSINVEAAIEAMLFVSDEPVSATVLAKMLELPLEQVVEALQKLQISLAQGERGIQLKEAQGGWRLHTHPAYHDIIERYVVSWDTRKLSSAAMETLAIVAYMQPITKGGVSGIRGVSSDSSINSLVEKGLVKEVGTSDSPGNPVLYATTATFLEKFGLSSVDDLTPLSEFAPDDETRNLILERLSANTDMGSVSEEEIASAMAEYAGAVEKIDFSKLQMNFDEE